MKALSWAICTSDRNRWEAAADMKADAS